jgi:hypothetical protein
MEKNVVDDAKPGVSPRMRLKVNGSKGSIGHGEDSLPQRAVNGTAGDVVDNVGYEGVPSPVVRSIHKFVDDNSFWVNPPSPFDGIKGCMVTCFRDKQLAAE